MSLVPLNYPPGIDKRTTPYAATGRYIDAQWVRFIAGLAAKMGGYEAVTADLQLGICRAARPWRDNSQRKWCGFGTSKRLYVMNEGSLYNITPFRGRVTGTLTDPFSTTSGSPTVNVAHTAHKQQLGDWTTLTATSAVGGLTIQGNYQVASVVDADNYTITASSNAGSTAGPGGGSTPYTYYRTTLGNNPITTTNGSSLVSIADTANLCTEGDGVVVTGAAAVGGITLSGEYSIVSATTNAYVVDAGTAASSGATGGGASVSVQNELQVGLDSASQGFGWGMGIYGSGTWGTSRSVSTTLDLRVWSLWAYGEWLLANPRGGALYKWDPNLGVDVRAIGLYNAPTQLLSFFVTQERYIVELGKDGDPLKIGWPDQENPETVIAALGNTANPSRKIQGGNFIYAGAPIRNAVNLILTDTSCFLHQWRGDANIFATTLLAAKAGIFGPNAWAVAGEVAYWVGDGCFFQYDGAVTELQSDDIKDFFFSNVDREQREKVFMSTIGQFGELIILYQETGETECNRYLICNPKPANGGGPVWTCGNLRVTAWADRSIFSNPIGVDVGGQAQYFETGIDGNGAVIDASITAAPSDLQAGNVNMDIMGFIPDIDDLPDGKLLYLTILLRDRPKQTPIEDGPYQITNVTDPIDFRSEGSMAGFKIETQPEVAGCTFTLGVNRVDIQPAGSRRPPPAS